jgi:SAM-dependent methyltransferase
MAAVDPSIFNLYYEPEHYDERYRDYVGDIAWWREAAARYGPKVLELACGSGRVLVPMAAAGATVTGVDISAGMLAAARDRAAEAKVDVRLVLGDMRSFEVADVYSLVVIPCSSMCHLITRADLEACLAQVRRALTPDGHLILDVLNPDLAVLQSDPADRVHRFHYTLERGRREVTVSGSRSYDRSTQVLTDLLDYSIAGDSRVHRVVRHSRMYFPEELMALLWYNGFDIVERSGGYSHELFTSTSSTQLLRCRQRGRRP